MLTILKNGAAPAPTPLKKDWLFFSAPEWKYTFFHKRSISPISGQSIGVGVNVTLSVKP